MEFFESHCPPSSQAPNSFEAAMTCAKLRQPGLNVSQAIGFGLGAYGHNYICT